MWKRKDVVAMGLAAVGTFGLTLATFMPRVVNATDAAGGAKVLSPVLHVSGCDVQVQALSTQEPTAQVTNRTRAAAAPGMVMVDAGPVPALTFIVKNTTDKEAIVAFSASIESSRSGGRTMSRPETQWNDSYDMVLAPRESRELKVDAKTTLKAGFANTLILRSDGETKTAISALTFNVPQQVRTQQPAPAAAAAVPANGIDPNKPVTFVTRTTTSSSSVLAGKSAVQLAVEAGLKAARQPSAAPAKETLARAESKLP